MNINATISRKPWILALLVFAVAMLWVLSGLFVDHDMASDTSQIQAAGNPDEAMKVQVATLEAEPVTRYINVYGRTAPARVVAISAETEGRVTEILATRGTQIKAGAPILGMDMRDRAARVKQSQASVNEHQTAYKAQSSLKADGYVSDTQIAETLAKLEGAKAELVRAKLDLKNRVITAPFNGVLKERDVEIGDFVRAGDQVATFVDNLTLIVTGTLAEQEVSKIKTGAVANAKLVTGESVSGKIRYVSPVADESTRTFIVELEIPNSDGALPAGVTAEIQLNGGEVVAQRISPALLTLDSKGTVGLMIVDSLNRAQFTPVKIEKSGTDGIWVSGLPESASVITVGQGYVSSGQVVNPAKEIVETALAAESLR